MSDYPRVTPGLFIPGRSSVEVSGMSSRERSSYRAEHGWWLRVGSEFVETSEVEKSTLRAGLNFGGDWPPGTKWQAGPKGARTTTSGVTKAIRARALGWDGPGENARLRVHPDWSAPFSSATFGAETRAVIDRWLEGRDPATMDFEPYWRRVVAAAARGEAKPWRVAAEETMAAEQGAEASDDAPTAWTHEEQQAMATLRGLSTERRELLLACLA